MSEWQKILKEESIATLEQLAEKFGRDAIDVEALKPAFDNFQMRITPAVLEQIREVGDPLWRQYVPSVEELDIQDGMIDAIARVETKRLERVVAVLCERGIADGNQAVLVRITRSPAELEAE